MITAIVLICTTQHPVLCTYLTYPDMLDTVQECEQLIRSYAADGKFKRVINKQAFDISDYMCINWNDQRI